MQGGHILKIEDLQVWFKPDYAPEVHAVKGVNISVQEGSILGVIGESGSGKSVTFLSLMRLLPPHSRVAGSIAFKSTDGTVKLLHKASLRALRRYALREISYIFQDPLSSLNPSLRIDTQMMECVRDIKSKSEARSQCLLMLEEVLPGLSERAFTSYPHQLSGGQRQRIVIAMALLSGAQLIIADEPTTALDPQVQRSILDLLHRLVTQHNKTLILISHDIHSIKDYCDEIAVFRSGLCVEYKPTDTLFSKPEHPYTQALIRCKPGPQNAGYLLPTVSDFLSTTELKPQPLPKTQLSHEVVLQAQHLSKQYKGSAWQLEPINLQLLKGECLGLIGESGSGKSTLARLLVLLDQPHSGQLILGRPEKGISIQMIFQDPYASLNPSMSIGSAIMEVIAIHQPELQTKAERREQMELLLSRVDIAPGLSNRKPASFSGGQRQRICIARALAARPDVLVCDEALSALDISAQAKVINILKLLQLQQGLSLVFITHDMNVARHVCNRIVILKDGKIMEEGPTAQLFAKPRHSYTQTLVSFYHS